MLGPLKQVLIFVGGKGVIFHHILQGPYWTILNPYCLMVKPLCFLLNPYCLMLRMMENSKFYFFPSFNPYCLYGFLRDLPSKSLRIPPSESLQPRKLPRCRRRTQGSPRTSASHLGPLGRGRLDPRLHLAGGARQRKHHGGCGGDPVDGGGWRGGFI